MKKFVDEKNWKMLLIGFQICLSGISKISEPSPGMKRKRPLDKGTLEARELFVPDLQETIRAHPDFMLFATQNPPGVYAGRKMLSRAFRNRFVEIHVDEIPQDELIRILKDRCKIPPSYAKKMVDVMKELHIHRQSSNVFAGKHGFITPRDMFRWADRYDAYIRSYEDLAYDGYYLMAERLRDNSEKNVVKEVLEKELKVKLADGELYKQVPFALV